MRNRTLLQTFRKTFLFAGLALSAAGQSVSTGSTALVAPNSPTIVPWLSSEFQQLAATLGNRLTVSGNERLNVPGTLSVGGVPGLATITWQLPNSYRIDLAGAAARSVFFNGAAAQASDGNLSENDLDMMESLLDDTAEIMFGASGNGDSIRVLTHRARLDDGKAKNYPGPWAMIYQVVGPVLSRPNRTARQKYYFFDAQTHLPMTVKYRIQHADGSVVLVETSRTNWSQVNGQWTPGTITRLENGKTVFVFQAAGAALTAAANDGIFQHP